MSTGRRLSQLVTRRTDDVYVPARSVQMALDGLVESETGPRFVPGALASISKVLTEDLQADPSALEEMLRLLVVLRKRSPATAEELADTLRRTPAACAHAHTLAPGARFLDLARGFAKTEGRNVVLRAPSVKEGRPDGAIPLSTLVDPTRRDRQRVTSRIRQEAKKCP